MVKAVQTCWDPRNLAKAQEHNWLSPEYFWMSCALSAFRILSNFNILELYASKSKKKVLIDELGIPYSNYYELPHDLGFPEEVWAMSKIFTYSCQQSPFLHFDEDVFIGNFFDIIKEKYDLVAQNLESGFYMYDLSIKEIQLHSGFIPRIFRKKNIYTESSNAGVIGGFDISFFSEYTSQAKTFIYKNKNIINESNALMFGVIAEQLLFHELAEYKKKTIKYVSNNIYSDPSYKDFNTSQKLPFSFDYIHLMGGFKRSYSFCTLIAKHLRSENAHMYYRIIKRTLESKVKTHNIFYQKGNLFYFEKICNEIKEAPFSKKNQWLVNDNLANEYINGIINFERGKHFFKKPVMEDFLYIKFNSSKFIYKVNDHKPYILGLDQYSPLLTRKYDLDFLGVLIVKNSQKQITFSKLIKSIKIHFQINNNSELYTFINFVNTKLKEFYFIGAIELKNP